MTRQITIELPESWNCQVPAKSPRTFETSKWTAEFILSNCYHGIGQRRSDKLSVTKDSAKLAELDRKISLGQELATGQGRGPNSTVEQRSWLDYLKLRGYHVKGKLISKIVDVARGQEYLARQHMLANGSTVETIESDIQSGLTAWIAEQERDQAGVGGLIAIKKMEEQLKAQISS